MYGFGDEENALGIRPARFGRSLLLRRTKRFFTLSRYFMYGFGDEENALGIRLKQSGKFDL